jgi:hypothetical protein
LSHAMSVSVKEPKDVGYEISGAGMHIRIATSIVVYRHQVAVQVIHFATQDFDVRADSGCPA